MVFPWLHLPQVWGHLGRGGVLLISVPCAQGQACCRYIENIVIGSSGAQDRVLSVTLTALQSPKDSVLPRSLLCPSWTDLGPSAFPRGCVSDLHPLAVLLGSSTLVPGQAWSDQRGALQSTSRVVKASGSVSMGYPALCGLGRPTRRTLTLQCPSL